MKDMTAADICEFRGLGAKSPWSKRAMIRSVILAALLVVLIPAAALPLFVSRTLISKRFFNKTSV